MTAALAIIGTLAAVEAAALHIATTHAKKRSGR